MLSLEASAEKLCALAEQIANDGKLTQIVALESESPLGSDVLMRQYYSAGGAKDYKLAMESIAGHIASMVLKALGFLLEMIGKFIKWVANFFKGKKTLTEELMDEAKEGAEKAKEKIREALKTSKEAILDTIKKQNLAAQFTRQMVPAHWDIFDSGAYSTLLKRIAKDLDERYVENLVSYSQNLAEWYQRNLKKAGEKDEAGKEIPDFEKVLLTSSAGHRSSVAQASQKLKGESDTIKEAISDLSRSHGQILPEDIDKCIDRAVTVLNESNYKDVLKRFEDLKDRMTEFQKSVEGWEDAFKKVENASRDDGNPHAQMVKKVMLMRINELSKDVSIFFAIFHQVIQYYREVTRTAIILLDYAVTAVEETAKVEGERYPKLKEQAAELKIIRDDVKKAVSKSTM